MLVNMDINEDATMSGLSEKKVVSWLNNENYTEEFKDSGSISELGTEAFMPEICNGDILADPNEEFILGLDKEVTGLVLNGSAVEDRVAGLDRGECQASALNKEDIKSFEVLFKEYYKPLCSYACEILNNSDLAEDVVAALFLRVWEHRGEIIIQKSLSSYLYRSTRNACLNVIRKKRYETLYREYFTRFDTTSRTHDYGSLSFPLSGIIEDDLARSMEKIVSGLSAQVRRVYILSRVDGLSHKEIAVRLEISVNTVKSQLMIALSRIQKEIHKII